MKRGGSGFSETALELLFLVAIETPTRTMTGTRFGLRRAARAPGFAVHTERTMNSLGDLTVSCIRKRRMPGKSGINPNTQEP
jgi:hypothetical protein